MNAFVLKSYNGHSYESWTMWHSVIGNVPFGLHG